MTGRMHPVGEGLVPSRKIAQKPTKGTNDMNKTFLGHLSAILAIVAMTLSANSLSFLTGYLSTTEKLVGALVLGVLILNLVYLPRHRLRKRTQEFTFAIAGLCGAALWIYLRGMALSHVNGAFFSVAYAIVPVGCVIALRLTGKAARFRAGLLSGCGFAIVGIILIAVSVDGLAFDLAGLLLTLAAALVLASFVVAYKAVVHTGHPIAILRRVLFWGLVFSIPLCFISSFDASHYLDLLSLAPALHMLLGAVALPCIAALSLGYCQKHLGAERAAAYLCALPVGPMLLALLSGAGGMSTLSAVGSVMVIVAIVLSAGKR